MRYRIEKEDSNMPIVAFPIVGFAQKAKLSYLIRSQRKASYARATRIKPGSHSYSLP